MGGASFPRTARLLNSADFNQLRARAERSSVGAFRIEFATNTLGTARLGLAVSRRVSKSAVRRNRIKRIARTSFRLIRAELPPLDILLVARASADAVDNPALRENLERVWRRLGALKATVGPGTMQG
jgi:ribonuclease P protein component